MRVKCHTKLSREGPYGNKRYFYADERNKLSCESNDKTRVLVRSIQTLHNAQFACAVRDHTTCAECNFPIKKLASFTDGEQNNGEQGARM